MDAMKARRLFKAETRRAELVTELLDTTLSETVKFQRGQERGQAMKGQALVQNELFLERLSPERGQSISTSRAGTTPPSRAAAVAGRSRPHTRVR